MNGQSYGFDMDAPRSDRAVGQYLRKIQGYPMLEAAAELALARRWNENKDIDAAHELVTSHLRLVAKIAKGYRRYGLPLADLVSEGNIGLMQAINRFDPDRGFRLSTYAMWWIRAAIQEYILHSWSMVKIGTTGAQKKLFFSLRRIKNQIEAIGDGDLSPENVTVIAKRLQVPESEVVDMNRRLSAQDQSLNVMYDTESERQDWLVDDSESQEDALADREQWSCRRELLTTALKSLNSREQHILVERHLKEPRATLESLSHEYGVSRERIRQIEVRAFEKVRAQVHSAEIMAA